MKTIASTLLVSSAVVVLAACSGVPGDVFPAPVPEAGPPLGRVDAGNFLGGKDAGTPAPAVCNPQSTATFQPAWQMPETWKQGVCTAVQMTDFYAACLTPPIVVGTCQAFVQANTNCAACLQSQETDATSAAVVWHEQQRYWTVNVAGCIARALGNLAPSGCGGAYGASIACRQASCDACWNAQGMTSTFPEFSDCESLAGTTTCLAYAEAVPAACGSLDQGPAGVCLPGSTATAQDAYMQIAPLFCGP